MEVQFIMNEYFSCPQSKDPLLKHVNHIDSIIHLESLTSMKFDRLDWYIIEKLMENLLYKRNFKYFG